jgi:hypothetical protein
VNRNEKEKRMELGDRRQLEMEKGMSKGIRKTDKGISVRG